MLKFVMASAEDRQGILDMCARTVQGTEAYTFLALHSDIPDGSFWCAKDETGKTVSVIFDDGDSYVKAAGDIFSPFFSYREKCLMIYKNESTPACKAEVLEGKDILNAFRLFCESENLSFDNERRYVLRKRAVNSGLARVFGVYSDDSLVSTASVSAMNEKYAMISDVYTRPDCRYRGFAAEAVSAATAFALDSGKTPFLICDEKMCSYYERAGFVYYGKM